MAKTGIIELIKESISLSVKKESLFIGIVYAAILVAFMVLLGGIAVVFIGSALISGASGTNPYAGGMESIYAMLPALAAIIAFSVLFSPVFSVVLIQGANDARKKKFDLNSIASSIPKKYLRLLGLEIITSTVTFAALAVSAIIIFALAMITGAAFGGIMNSNPLLGVILVIIFAIIIFAAIAVPLILVYPFLFIVCVPAVIEDIPLMKTISKTIDLVKKNYKFNLKAVLAYFTSAMALVIALLVLAFIPIAGSIIAWALTIIFSVYSIHYAIGLYELNQK